MVTNLSTFSHSPHEKVGKVLRRKADLKATKHFLSHQ